MIQYYSCMKKTWRSGPQRKGSDRICKTCGKSYYRPPSSPSVYCSAACMSIAFSGRISPQNIRQQVSCAFCGSAILRAPWHIKQSQKAFCTRRCFGKWKAANWTAADNPAWTGGKAYYYGENWKRQSRLARFRDGHKCRVCGKPEDKNFRVLDVHHVIPFRRFGLADYRAANSLANLITLCPSCHCQADRNVRGLRVKSSCPVQLCH
jgi:5-methylcytosine-specific restriction endonuclease McrA